MNDKQIINEVLMDELGVAEIEISPGSKLVEDLGADSLDLVEIAMRLEEEFGIDISVKDNEEFSEKTVQQIYDYIEQHIKIETK